MNFKLYISRVIRRVIPFIGLRGSLAADQTARMLRVLLAILAVWLAAAFVGPRSVRSDELPTDIQYRRRGSELRHDTRGAPAGLLPARQSDVPRRHLDLGDPRLHFLWRRTQPGSGALRVLPISAAWLIGYESAVWIAVGGVYRGSATAHVH